MPNNLPLEDNFAITNLIGLYAQLVDGGQHSAWAALYTADEIFEVPDIVHLQGPTELPEMVDTIHNIGNGKVRHQITNLYITAGNTSFTARVTAYGLVTSWDDRFKPVSCTDYDIQLTKVDGHWRFSHVLATPLSPPNT